MNYNWGDPKKNSKLTSIMMTKAEASRKKRLSSVKSTLSNNLHSGAESKLKKKKKSPDSARREAGDFDPEAVRVENNNHLEPSYEPIGFADGSSNNDCNDSEDYSSSSHSRSIPIFEKFSLNAAADGLFHPASTIEAFIEHDAKYQSDIQAKNKPTSGRSSLSSRSGSRSSTVGEYLPSLENQKLPVLLNEKGKRGKLDSASSSQSAASSSSSLLDSPGRSSSRNHTISSTRSDSDLHAPRRLGAVPSSADRNALDFYDHDGLTDDESDDDDRRAGARVKTSPPDLGSFSLSGKLGSKHGSSRSAASLSEVPSQADASLTKKFEDLKLLMNAKRSSKQGDHQKDSIDHPQKPAPREPQAATIGAKQQGKSRVSSSTKLAGDHEKVEKQATASSSRPAKPSSGETKASAETRPKFSTSITVPVVTKTPPIKSKKDMQIRNGVSLSDLKEEHRAALEMLKELGGPVDTDYEHADPEESTKAPAPKNRSARSTKAKDARKTSIARSNQSNALSNNSGLIGKSTLSAPSAAISPREQQHDKNDPEPQSSSPKSHGGGSLVAKLRASIPSGRVTTPEPTPESTSPVFAANSSLMKSQPLPGSGADEEGFDGACEEEEECSSADGSSVETHAAAGRTHSLAGKDVAALHAASFVLRPQDRSLENVAEVDEEEDDPEGDINSANQHDGEPDLQQVTFDDSWKRYEDNEGAGDDDDGEDEPNNGEPVASEYSKSAPTTARSVDLYGDDGFESEW